MGWRAYIPHALFWGGILGFITAVVVMPLRKRREAKDLSKRVAKAREQILADGKVEGPKGPYVPHKKWNVGTPHETEPIKTRSYDGGPWPD